MIRVLALEARRDRLTLPLWVVGLALLLLVTAQAASVEYGTVAERRGVLTLALATPALLALRGVPDGDSLGSAMHFQSFAFLAVGVGLMNTFLAVRHGRGDEAAGRREAVDATPAGRLAEPVATLQLAVAANAALAVLAVAGYASAGLPLPGAVLSASGLALVGLVCFGVGRLAGEAAPASRAANGAAVAVVLVLYALRAAGDALGTADAAALTLRPAWPSALSPIGWGQALLPFTRPDARPLLALAGTAAATIAASIAVHARREAGTSLVPERRGRDAAAPSLGGPFALAWRLHRTALLGWAVGAAALAGVTPSLVAAVADAGIADGTIRRILVSLGHTRAGVATELLASVLVLVGVLAAAAGVQAVLRAREEEASGRAELLLATPVSRARWLGAHLATAVLTVVAVLAAAAVAVAIGDVAAGRSASAGEAALQALVQAPSALALTAVAALLVALLPRAAVSGSWAVLGAAVAVGLFGDAMHLPRRLVALTPVGSVPALPTGDWGPTAATLAAAVVLLAAAVVAIRRRAVLA